MDNKDLRIIEHIAEWCEELNATKQRFGGADVFATDIDYFKSISMSVLQIGELVNHFSKEFLQKYTAVPWHSIVALRNIIVHGYGAVHKERLWATLCTDIPQLLEFCNQFIEPEEGNKQ
jgi:uncharacterized protein with HEPN domain